MSNDNLMVSVAMLTYNHEKYISQAIESVLSQKVNFQYEIVIAEDCSTDKTREIVKQFEQKNNRIIRVIYQEKNLGAWENNKTLLSSLNGKYVAALEGDDYWIDPYKLQKQVDFLEANPDYGLVFTDADHLHEETGKIIKSYDKTFRRNIPTGNVFENLLYGNPYRTCTAVFNREMVDKKSHLFSKHQFKVGDRLLWFLIAGESKVGYLKNSTAVYRIQKVSASHQGEFKQQLSFIKNGYKMSLYFSEFYSYQLNKKKLKYNFKKIIISTCIQKGYYKELLNYCGDPILILSLFSKEKIFRKIFLGFK